MLNEKRCKIYRWHSNSLVYISPSSCHAASTDLPGPLSPTVSTVHLSRKVCIGTELLYIVSQGAPVFVRMTKCWLPGSYAKLHRSMANGTKTHPPWSAFQGTQPTDACPCSVGKDCKSKGWCASYVRKELIEVTHNWLAFTGTSYGRIH